MIKKNSPSIFIGNPYIKIKKNMTSSKDFYVVGIGASAGGLEAIEAFFSTVPSNSGLAYVIIQHLSPDYKSLMPEILIKRTSLPVHTAEDGMLVKPDNVYLIPRKMNMKIFHSKLHLTEKSTSHMLNLPIDIFFQSLAEDFEEKAIAIVLSGTGSDGSRGIRMVKERGGIVIAHDPDNSKFDGMPKSAITTGTVDYILRPQDMPAKIISYVGHPYIQKKDRDNYLSMVPEDYLSKIILIVKEAYGLDFTYYKDTTISRRIERRLSINQIENLRDYLEYLSSSKIEQKTLYNELLIGVTKFFRDTEAFLLVENEVIPKIFENKTEKDEIRIWISACSTGEEAYSIAILFKEYMKKNSLYNDIKIFATDVDKSAVEYASTGIYNSSITADVSSERLDKFFNQLGENSYRINDSIREMIVFASHNVIKDPPFNKIDFLTCRNLLIYFQAPLQQKVLSVFNFALNKNGYLFLGSSETIGEMETYFETFSHKWKIFKSVRSAKLAGNTLSRFPGGIVQNVPIKKPVYTLKNSANDLVNIFTEKILIENSPVTVVVNENYEIVNSFGDLNKFLSLPNINKIADGFEFNLSKMVPKNLKLTFSIAINKAIKSQTDVIHHNIKYQRSDEKFLLVDLIFSPLKRPDLNQKFVVVYFKEKETTKNVPQEIQSYENVDQLVLQRIADLENELKHNKENLQASIEELETTNEELQSTNEELISANEELQSTNEELQSVNEELYTVNTEFQIKNADLVVMNNDMENLLLNSDVRIIFLDIDLKIRKFTENITDIFNLKKNDHGRPILDITHHLIDINPFDAIQPVLKNHSKIIKTVKAKERWFQMKIMPYLTQKGFMDGVVLSFIDITDYYNTQSELKISEDKFNLLFEFIPMGITISDKNGKIITSNATAERILGIKKEEQQNRKIDGKEWKLIKKDGTLMPAEEFASVRAIKENKLVENVEMGVVDENGNIRWILVSAIPTEIENMELAISYSDITSVVEREIEHKKIKQINETIYELNEVGLSQNVELKSFSQLILNKLLSLIDCENGYIAAQKDGKIEYLATTNKINECKNRNNCKISILEKNEENCFCNLAYTEKHGFYTNNVNEIAKKHKLKANRIEWKNFLSVPIHSDNQILGQIVLTDKSTDFNEFDFNTVQRLTEKLGIVLLRIQAKEKLTFSNKLYQSIFNNMSSGFAFHQIILDEKGKPIDYKFIDINKSFEKLTGLLAKNVIGKTIKEILPNIETEWIEKYGHVALTGEKINFEYFAKPLNKKFKVNAYSPEKGMFATIFEEVS